MSPLAIRLAGLLSATHAALGAPVEPLLEILQGDEEAELHQLSPTGVLAFIGDYVLGAWPDDELRVAAPAAHRLLSARLKARGFTRHVVYPLNFRSVKLTRKMGAKPHGVDADGFVHYVLRSEDFPHHTREEQADGQEV